MVSQAKGGCRICKSMQHTAFKCPQRPVKKALVKKTVKKKPSRSKLVKELDAVFSQYIRASSADKHGNTTCVTCGDVKPWKQHQNGHYESRGHLPTRWSEDNCAPQCVACNVFKKGNYTEYALYMIKTYGAEKLDELKQRARSGEKVPTTVIVEKIAEYKDKLKQFDK